MKTKVFLVLLGLSIMLGCTATARLYPVQGPLSQQAPLPVFVGKLNGSVNSGNISFVMADGEVCTGRWTRVVSAAAPKNGTAVVAPAAGAPPSTGMASIWDTVYGSGYFVAHVLGDLYWGTAVITGNRGTVLNVEFYRANPPGTRIAGVAKDSKGNIYKMVFSPTGA